MSRFPSLWVVLMGLGTALLVAALALVIWAEMSRVPQVTVQTTKTLGAETHRVLVGDQDPSTLDPEVAPVESLPLKRLDASLPVVAAGEGQAPAPSSSRDERASKRTDGDDEPASARPRASAPSADPAHGAATVPVRSGRHIVLDLKGGTRIRRTLPMKSPHRFVVDVVGLQEYAPGPVDHPKVKGVRFGRHEGYGRIVVDMNGPAKGTRASLRDGTLTIRFD